MYYSTSTCLVGIVERKRKNYICKYWILKTTDLKDVISENKMLSKETKFILLQTQTNQIRIFLRHNAGRNERRLDNAIRPLVGLQLGFYFLCDGWESRLKITDGSILGELEFLEALHLLLQCLKVGLRGRSYALRNFELIQNIEYIIHRKEKVIKNNNIPSLFSSSPRRQIRWRCALEVGRPCTFATK